MQPAPTPASTWLWTTSALVAFAANSVLCRLALGSGAIDALAFTAVRVGTGALALALLVRLRKGGRAGGGSWAGACALLVYALPFSLAYLELDAGTGALLLFGAVQVTMIGLGLRGGERPGPLAWLGLVGAAGGVVYLVAPGVTAPDPLGAGSMVLAGVGWGLYSIAGRRAVDPLGATAGHFARAACVALPLAVVARPLLPASLAPAVSAEGALLASASGALASGLGYAVWYAALAYLSATRAALVQLAVPVLAAAGGVLFLGEAVTPRLAIATVVILGSIALGTLDRARA